MENFVSTFGRDRKVKILVFNFLRLGDILMTCPILDQIRRRHPGSEIHYLAYEEFKVASQVLPQIDRWHWISREELKKSLQSLDHGLLDPLDHLMDVVKALNSENFDQVICLSHTLAGSHFLSLIDAKHKIGAHFQERGLVYSSDGFRKFDLSPVEVQRNYHYLDWYRMGLEFQEEPVTWNFDTYSKDTRSRRTIRKIAIQPLSADEKKGWTTEKWMDFVQLVREMHPDVEINFLCAPSEEPELRSLFQNVAKISGVSLQNALEVIRSSDIFITVDTSIKHLANGTATPVVELCFGSSDYRKQGIYKADSWIVVSKDDCHPCSMDSLCPKAQRTCTKDIRASELVHFIFSENKSQKFFKNAKIYKTKMIAGYWRSEEIHEDRKEASDRHPEA